MQLSQAEHARIAQAVAEAESKADGEIVCVLARRSSQYREIPLAWACAAALVLPLVLIPFGFGPSWLPGFAGGWTAAHSTAVDSAVKATLTVYAAAQAVIFLIALLVVSLPPVRRVLTPASLRRERVREAALEQFVARGLHLADGRVGVLIFASMAERQVQILADEAIHNKVGQEVWKDAVAALTAGLRAGRPGDGFVSAVGICGRVMAEHFPSAGENVNALPNDLIEI